ncbi:MAG: hypothetical protein KJ630_22400, partial [Proteobacteria bacterium]|nr:hypothetical protein [Pseudomonadota bacterium]
RRPGSGEHLSRPEARQDGLDMGVAQDCRRREGRVHGLLYKVVVGGASKVQVTLIPGYCPFRTTRNLNYGGNRGVG